MNFYSPGALIAGRYEVAGRPLIGGMGIVYVCLDRKENRPVALKTFKPEYLPDRAARDRFLREGTAWVDLGAHPHVVRCYRVERIGDGTEVYLVLELIAKAQGYPDASLRSWLIPGHPLPLETALLFALQIARGMQHAVECSPGFVHRDLKPENVLVGADRLPGWSVNRLRVTDFGLAAVLKAEGGGLKAGEEREDLGRTQLTHGLVGTPLYMAPEQWRGEPVGVYTDVYAWVCILYELLTGQPAVAGRSLAALRRAHCAGEVQPLSSNVPVAVRELVTRCLALDPAQRYADWGAVEAALVAALAAVTGQAVPATPTAAALSREERGAMGWSYNTIGISYCDIGKAKVAIGYFERAQAISAMGGDRRGESVALVNLGLAYWRLGEAQRALGYYEQALTIKREIGDRHGEGVVLGNLGETYRHLGDARCAIRYCEQARVILREFRNRRAEGAALNNLGAAYYQLGDRQRALGYFKQALAIWREIGDRFGEGSCLNNLGGVYADLGDTRRAIEYHKQALAIAREIGDRREEGAALGNLGLAYADLGDARRAIEYHEQDLSIAREIGDRHGEVSCLNNLVVAYADLGDARRALEYSEQALAIAREIEDRRGEGYILGNLGRAYADLAEARRALEYFEQGLAIAREIGDTADVATTLFDMALLHAQQGDVAHALPLAQEAARIFAQIGSPNAQRAQRLVAQLQSGRAIAVGGTTAGGGPDSTQILAQFAEGITAVVAGAQGDDQARAAVTAEFAQLTQEGWLIVEPIQRIWAGERDAAALTAGLDESDALIVREILRQLAR